MGSPTLESKTWDIADASRAKQERTRIEKYISLSFKDEETFKTVYCNRSSEYQVSIGPRSDRKN